MGAQDPGHADRDAYAPIMRQAQAEYIAEQKAKGENPSETPWTYKEWRTYQVSDHLPMWLELRVDFSDEYLASLTIDDGA